NAHFRTVLGSGTNLYRTVQVELRVARVAVVDRSERWDNAGADLRDDRGLLQRCKKSVPFGMLDPGGDLEVRLATMPPGRGGQVRYEAEPHTPLLALVNGDGFCEDGLAGKRDFAEEGAPEDRSAFKRAWWSGPVVRIGCRDRRAAQAIHNR